MWYKSKYISKWLIEWYEQAHAYVVAAELETAYGKCYRVLKLYKYNRNGKMNSKRFYDKIKKVSDIKNAKWDHQE